jgi:hypothetical protein
VIGLHGFSVCISLREILFSSDRHVKAIHDFYGCTSLGRIEIPSSVEVIRICGFNGCTWLKAIVFSSDTNIKEIVLFAGWRSHSEIENPSSTEVVKGFWGCSSFRFVIFDPRCRVRNNTQFRLIHPFLVHEYSDLKENRRRIHLSKLE